jgi:hypothetical protein
VTRRGANAFARSALVGEGGDIEKALGNLIESARLGGLDSTSSRGRSPKRLRRRLKITAA